MRINPAINQPRLSSENFTTTLEASGNASVQNVAILSQPQHTVPNRGREDSVRGLVRKALERLTGLAGVTPAHREKVTVESVLSVFKPISNEMENRHGLPPGLIGTQLTREMLEKSGGASVADNIAVQGFRMGAAYFLQTLDKPWLEMTGKPFSTLFKGENGFSALAGNVKAIPNLTPEVIARIKSDPLRTALWNAYVKNKANGYPHVLPVQLTDAVNTTSKWQTVRNTMEVMAVVFASFRPHVEQFARMSLADRQAIFPDHLDLQGSAQGLNAAQRKELYSYIYLHGAQALENRALQVEINKRLPEDRQIKVDGYMGDSSREAQKHVGIVGPRWPR